MRRACLLVIAVSFLLGRIDAACADRVRGIVLSTHGDGADWASSGAAAAMDSMRAAGANWVSIHPYARIDEDGTVRFQRFLSRPEIVALPIQSAHARGLKIAITPHLAYWGSRFSWQGEIAFETPEQWDRFWATYRSWILAVVDASANADAFVIGTELDRTLSHESRWRDLIRDVRARTKAPLTYGANWTDYSRVPFWDALDIIGVQAYFPLTDSSNVTARAIESGWNSRMRELRDYARTQDRRIVFTELGYDRSRYAPVRPWATGDGGTDGDHVQELCLRTALRAVEHEPVVVGAFLWKWFPEPRPVGRDFQIATPRLRRIVAESWSHSTR